VDDLPGHGDVIPAHELNPLDVSDDGDLHAPDSLPEARYVESVLYRARAFHR
jgi:hypothetical protein